MMTNNQLLKQHKYVIFLSMFYVTVMLCSAIFIYKPVAMWVGFASGATLIFPICFVLSDVIADVYGFKISQQVLWSGFMCQLLFSIGCFIMLKTPSPAFWHNHLAFELVLGHLFRITIMAFISIMISGYVNIYLITKWKILLKGRYFWARSIGASIVGEGVYSVTAIILIQYNVVPLSQIPMMIFWAYSFKIIATLILAAPASFLCAFLKVSEGRDNYQEKNLKNQLSHSEIESI